MNTETINTQLYEKMFAEQERYRDWLLHQPPEEILNHAYEYAIREDILMALEYRRFELRCRRKCCYLYSYTIGRYSQGI